MIEGNNRETPPGDAGIEHSAAFRDAALTSEIQRSYAVVGVVFLVAILIIGREPGEHLDTRLIWTGVIGVCGLLLVQVVALATAIWSRRRGRAMPRWFVFATVAVESMIPTAMIYANMKTGSLSPYAAMNSPPVMTYGLMLSLTTLRLQPGLCILAGLLSAAGYAGLLFWIRHGYGLATPDTGLPYAAYANAGILILVSGFAAAWVAWQIRKHVTAALGEAETKRKMARIEHDLSVASTIQRALLPRAAPTIPGYDIAGWNRPADQTGGDYYDWQAMPDGRWIITLADVSGHGVGPAMVTAACRAYMRALSGQHQDLSALATRMNQLLAEDLPEGKFVTMASVLIDPNAGGSLALLSAGHGPIVLFARGPDEVREIIPDDLPLAILPETSYGQSRPIALETGDVLALVTDGFVEWARTDENGRREDFGMRRLQESLRKHADLPPSAMIEAIAADVQAFARGTPQQDDLTMVVIRKRR